MSVSTPGLKIPGKIQSLDGLRAFAIILVLLRHVGDQFPVVSPATFYPTAYMRLGWMGVDLFFVLSGFLITGILLDTREARNYFSGFYARRALRIFPLYYCVLTVVIVVGALLRPSEFSSRLPIPQDYWLFYFYLTNCFGLWKTQVAGQIYIAHFWSLAVEEQFYFVWPLVVWLVPRRAIPWIAGALAGLAAVLRLLWVAHGEGPVVTSVSFATFARMDTLFVGAICACLFRDQELMRRVSKWLPWIAGLAIGAFVACFTGALFFPRQAQMLLYGSPGHTLDLSTILFAERGGYTLLALGFGALILRAAQMDGQRTFMQHVLRSRLLGVIGRYSYGIYVYHVPILGLATVFLLPRLLQGGESQLAEWLAFIIVVLSAIFVVSAISYELFERKILGLKRHFEARYTPAGSVPSIEDPIQETPMAQTAVMESEL